MFLDDLIALRSRYRDLIAIGNDSSRELHIRSLDGTWQMSIVVNALGSHSVRVARDSYRPVRDGNITGVLRVVSRSGKVDGAGRDYLEVMCLDPRLTETFDQLALEFAENLFDRPQHSPESVLHELIDKWKKLLATPSKNVTEEDVVGLLGELLVLRKIVSMNPQIGVSVWAGPTGHRHDFTGVNADIEVKTTTSVRSQLLRITNEDQLDPVNQADLVLARVSLVKHPSGISLNSLISDLNGMGLAASEIRERIESVLGTVVDGVMDDKYVHLSTKYYRVDEQFPSLKTHDENGQLPPGIMAVEYVVDLSAIDEMTEVELDGHVERFF